MGAGSSSSSSAPVGSRRGAAYKARLAAAALRTHEKWSERAAVGGQSDAEAKRWAGKHCRRPDCKFCAQHRAHPGALAPAPYLGRPTPDKSRTLRRERLERRAREHARREALARACPVDSVTFRWLAPEEPERPPVPQLLLEHRQEEEERCSREGSERGSAQQESAPGSPTPSWMLESSSPPPRPLKLPPIEPALLEPAAGAGGVLPRKAIMKNASKAWKATYGGEGGAAEQRALESFMAARLPTPLHTLACAREIDFGAHGHMFSVTARGGEDVRLVALRTGPHAAPPTVRGVVVSEPCVLYAAPNSSWRAVSRIRDPWQEVGRTTFARQADLGHRIVLDEPLLVRAGETLALYLHSEQRYGLGFSLAGDGMSAPTAGQDQFLEAAVGVAVHCQQPWDWVNRGILPNHERRAEAAAAPAAPKPGQPAPRATQRPPPPKTPSCNISVLDVSFSGVLEYELPRCAEEHALAQELRADPEGAGEAVAALLDADAAAPLYERAQEPYHEFANRYWELFCRRRHQMVAWRRAQEIEAMETHSDDDSHHSSDVSDSESEDNEDRHGEV